MENEMEDNVLNEIIRISKEYNLEKVVLFGSRARGDNSPVSDYDIAVFDNSLSDIEKASFCLDIEGIETLKKIDIVFTSDSLSIGLLENINKDGVIIYEQTRNKTNKF
ncbi:MAG: nucleotidyltransferase domain-containing protein [Clostridiaceae bacterium]|nr:nucleotidyltransferase domain-containing protein [Clostridiaceae bacterium]